MSAALPTAPIHHCLRAVEEIPPLSGNAARLIEMLGNDGLTLAKLSAAIEQSPSVAARIVGVASSAFFGAGRRITSVRDAVVRVLGLELVKALAIGAALGDALDTRACRAFSAEQYWANAMLAGAMSREAARLADPAMRLDPDVTYLAGLLHNLGLVALIHVAPESMNAVLSAAARDPQRPLNEIELTYLDTHHAEAGTIVAARWSLPEPLPTVIARHHDLDYRGEYWASCVLVGVCVQWARQRIAGVEEPWLDHQAAAALGIEAQRLDTLMSTGQTLFTEVSEVAKVMSGGDG